MYIVLYTTRLNEEGGECLLGRDKQRQPPLCGIKLMHIILMLLFFPMLPCRGSFISALQGANIPTAKDNLAAARWVLFWKGRRMQYRGQIDRIGVFVSYLSFFTRMWAPARHDDINQSNPFLSSIGRENMRLFVHGPQKWKQSVQRNMHFDAKKTIFKKGYFLNQLLFLYYIS